MKENIEIEYKILLSKEQFEKLASDYPQLVFITQVNTYYDTASHELRSKHCAMRIREKQGAFLFTLKSPSEQGLLEHEIAVQKNNPEVFNTPEIKALLNDLGVNDEVIAIAQCSTNRAVLLTDHAEICFDVNQYNGITDYEIEYEYINDHDGKPLFNELLSRIGMTYTVNCKSKIARAMESKQ